MSMGSSLNVNASGFSLRYLNILLVLLWALWNAVREENLKEYLGHSTRRCDRDWNSSKHVHPRGSWGKNLNWYSPVGAWPEIKRVNRLNRVISFACLINCLPLPSQTCGIYWCLFFFSLSSFDVVNGHQDCLHSLITRERLSRMRDAIESCGCACGPAGGCSAALSTSSFKGKPRWLGIQRNSIQFSGEADIHVAKALQFAREVWKAVCGLVEKSERSVAWLSMNMSMAPIHFRFEGRMCHYQKTMRVDVGVVALYDKGASTLTFRAIRAIRADAYDIKQVFCALLQPGGSPLLETLEERGGAAGIVTVMRLVESSNLLPIRAARSCRCIGEISRMAVCKIAILSCWSPSGHLWWGALGRGWSWAMWCRMWCIGTLEIRWTALRSI